MNATTFTIESVHGIKQTIVLGPTGTIAVPVSRGDKLSDQDRRDPAGNELDASKPR